MDFHMKYDHPSKPHAHYNKIIRKHNKAQIQARMIPDQVPEKKYNIVFLWGSCSTNQFVDDKSISEDELLPVHCSFPHTI
jgi:hypothetical protein